jgi:hypothetical protein
MNFSIANYNQEDEKKRTQKSLAFARLYNNTQGHFITRIFDLVF